MEKITGQNPVTTQPTIQPLADVDVKKEIEEIAPLFGTDPNVQVTTGGTTRVDGLKKKPETKEIPEIDEADEELLAIEADLEALIALLTAEQDEKTLEATKKRIESLKAQMEQHHTTTMKKVEESLNEMKKQERASLANKILGWLGVAVACIVAAALVCTVGGSAAAVAVVGAAIAVTMQTLNETGVMEKLAKAISDSMAKTFPNMSKEARDAWAQGIVAGIGIALSLATIIGGGFASAGTGLLKVSEAAMKTVRTAMLVTNSLMTAAGLAGSAAGTVTSYNAQQKQADVTETQQLLLELQTLLEQEQSDLEEILQKLEDAFGTVIDLLQSKQDALNAISMTLEA